MRYTFLCLSFILVLSGCNGSPDPSQTQPESTGTTSTVTQTGTSSPTTTFKTAVITDASGQIAAYVVGFLKLGTAILYVPSADQYVQVNLNSGAYVTTATVYYAGSNCTGQAYFGSNGLNQWFGEVGKTVLYDGVGFFLVTGPSASQSVSAQSTCVNGITTNATTQAYDPAPMTPVQEPYDFAAIAPLQVSYQ